MLVAGTRLVLSGVVCLFVCGMTNFDHLREIPRGCSWDEDVSKDVFCLFVCLFVGIKCLLEYNPKHYTPPPTRREVNPLGVVTHEQRLTLRRASQRQRHDSTSPRTFQSMVNTLKLTGWLSSLIIIFL